MLQTILTPTYSAIRKLNFGQSGIWTHDLGMDFPLSYKAKKEKKVNALQKFIFLYSADPESYSQWRLLLVSVLNLVHAVG